MVDVGEILPDIEVKMVFNEEIKIVNLRSFIGKPLVIYFYPKDDTPGCTKEACSFRDDINLFRKNGINVLGVSVQNEDSHKKFIKKYKINFPLISDKEKKLSKIFGVLKESGYAKRMTFIFDEKGICRHVFNNVNPEGHSKEVFNKMKELNLI